MQNKVRLKHSKYIKSKHLLLSWKHSGARWKLQGMNSEVTLSIHGNEFWNLRSNNLVPRKGLQYIYSHQYLCQYKSFFPLSRQLGRTRKIKTNQVIRKDCTSPTSHSLFKSSCVLSLVTSFKYSSLLLLWIRASLAD